MGGTPVLLWATKTAEMNELDSHLEKTSEIFEIGSVEKKLQLLKGGNISKLFAGAKFLHVFGP